MLRIKSVHEPIDPTDGLRILAARARGHGLKKNRYDVWMPSLGPSEKLLRYFRAANDRTERWPEFKRRYEQEIYAPAGIDKDNALIKNHGQKFTLRLLKQLAAQQNVTVMCHCESDEHCHRRLLRDLIRRA
ncbi:MAG TPA: DUF488 family protein [Polyangiaceae bacterium]|jgi:uncharacterized protein YeaO (DUF488 family)